MTGDREKVDAALQEVQALNPKAIMEEHNRLAFEQIDAGASPEDAVDGIPDVNQDVVRDLAQNADRMITTFEEEIKSYWGDAKKLSPDLQSGFDKVSGQLLEEINAATDKAKGFMRRHNRLSS